MKLAIALLLVQLPSAFGLFDLCFLMGFLGTLFASNIRQVMNDSIAGEEQDTGMLPFDKFVIDDFALPTFNGCAFSFTADFTFFNSITGVETEGDATIGGTFDLYRMLFSFFQQLCVNGLEVTDLEMDDSPGQTFEDFARDYINDQFEDPQCF